MVSCVKMLFKLLLPTIAFDWQPLLGIHVLVQSDRNCIKRTDCTDYKIRFSVYFVIYTRSSFVLCKSYFTFWTQISLLWWSCLVAFRNNHRQWWDRSGPHASTHTATCFCFISIYFLFCFCLFLFCFVAFCFVFCSFVCLFGWFFCFVFCCCFLFCFLLLYFYFYFLFFIFYFFLGGGVGVCFFGG